MPIENVLVNLTPCLPPCLPPPPHSSCCSQASIHSLLPSNTELTTALLAAHNAPSICLLCAPQDIAQLQHFALLLWSSIVLLRRRTTWMPCTVTATVWHVTWLRPCGGTSLLQLKALSGEGEVNVAHAHKNCRGVAAYGAEAVGWYKRTRAAAARHSAAAHAL